LRGRFRARGRRRDRRHDGADRRFDPPRRHPRARARRIGSLLRGGQAEPLSRPADALAGVSILEAKGTEQAPAGHGGLGICASPSASLDLLERSDEEVSERLFADAERLLGMPIEGVAAGSVVRLREGVPLFAVGWVARLAGLRQRLAPSPIAAAGDYLASPSLEGAVKTGEEAAERVAAWLAPRTQG
jgi:oxygen-dependent protoporphyrinogen oxidase